MPKVKICGLTSLEDVKVASKADFCGAILYPESPRFVSFEESLSLFDSLDPAKRVYVLAEPSISLLETILKKTEFAFIQIHFSLYDENWMKILSPNQVFLAPKVKNIEDFHPYGDVENYLLDTYSPTGFGGTGKVSDHSIASEVIEKFLDFKIGIAGGLNLNNYSNALLAKPYLLDFNSGLESSPAVKDHIKINKLFDSLQAIQK